MIYKVKTAPRFDREFKSLDRYTMKMMKVWIEKNLVNCENPHSQGKALGNVLSKANEKSLTEERQGEWHYRIGDYRLICHISDGEIVILSLSVGQRR